MKIDRYKRSSIKTSAIINKIKATVDPQVPGAILISPEPKPTAIKWKIFFMLGKLFFSMVPTLLSWKFYFVIIKDVFNFAIFSSMPDQVNVNS